MTIATIDGLQRVELRGESRAVCRSIEPGDYLEADGVKEHEQLFFAENVTVRPLAARPRQPGAARRAPTAATSTHAAQPSNARAAPAATCSDARSAGGSRPCAQTAARATAGPAVPTRGPSQPEPTRTVIWVAATPSSDAPRGATPSTGAPSVALVPARPVAISVPAVASTPLPARTPPTVPTPPPRTADPTARATLALAPTPTSVPTPGLLTRLDRTEGPTADSVVSFTLSVTNAGPRAATNVTLSDPLPSDAVFRSASPSQGSCAQDGGLAGTVTCWLGTLPPGATATVSIVVTSPNPTAPLGSPTVSADGPGWVGAHP